MALKADRYEESTDISFFSSATGVKGAVVCLDAAALAGASGAALDQGENTVSAQAAATTDIHVGIILNDVVNKDLTRTHLNQYKALGINSGTTFFFVSPSIVAST